MRAKKDKISGSFFAGSFAKAEASFSAAARDISQTEYFISINNRFLRICFAGNAASEPVMEALSHLISPPHPEPDLTLFIWDSGSVQNAEPEIPFEIKKSAGPDGYVFKNKQGCLYFSLDSSARKYQWYSPDSRRAFFWAPDLNRMSLADRAAPLRMIFYWWLRNCGLQMVHGAAVGTAKGGVLLAGKGGSGKSTTALACLDSDLKYAADDYAAVSLEPPYEVHSLYHAAKRNKKGIPAKAPEMRAHFSDEKKECVFIGDNFPKKIIRSFPLKAVLFPVISKSAAEPALVKISPAEALKQLAPNTLLQMAGVRDEDFNALAKLAGRVPSYRLELCHDTSLLPGAISGLITSKNEKKTASKK